MIWKDIRNIFFVFLFFIAVNPKVPCAASEESSKRLALINNALRYLGTPYRYGGRTRKGMDCSGFVCRSVFDILSLQLPRRSDAIAETAKKIPDSAVQPGDLLFFNTTGRISHTGIYLGAGQFIHSASDGPQTGVIISSIQEAYWKKAYRFAGRILEPENIFTAEAAVPLQSRTGENSNLHPAIRLRLSPPAKGITVMPQQAAADMSNRYIPERQAGFHLL